MTTIAIHQPEYLPWLGFIKKIMDCDVFVLFDDVQFERKDFHNRNRIRTGNGSLFLTVPVQSSLESKINEVEIDNTKHWANKHKKSILINYSKAEFFKNYKEFFEQLYEKRFKLLVDLNYEIIQFIKEEMHIKTKIIYSSELNIDGKSSERILNICKTLKADIYNSGIHWALKNLDVNLFAENNIKIQFQNFIHPEYKQCYKPFLPNMSVIDLLFNEGENSIQILRNAKAEIKS